MPRQPRFLARLPRWQLATLPVYHVFQYCETSFKTYQYSVHIVPGTLRIQSLGAAGEGGGGGGGGF